MKKKEAKIKQVYEYIDSYTQDNGFPPSVREICTACNVKSTASVYDYINILVEQGLLSKGDSKKRAITSVKGKVNYRSVPVVGTVTAGQPILAYENIEGYYPLPDEFGQDVFMLSVIGSSMIDAGIYSGDKIIVKRQTTAENGDIVVAFFEDKSTVKRFYKKEDHVILHPENTSMHDIILPDVEILGKVIGLVRKM